MPKKSTASKPNLNKNERIKHKQKKYYISKFHNSYFIYFRYFIYFVYFIFSVQTKSPPMMKTAVFIIGGDFVWTLNIKYTKYIKYLKYIKYELWNFDI